MGQEETAPLNEPQQVPQEYIPRGYAYHLTYSSCNGKLVGIDYIDILMWLVSFTL